eukprot:TRINITY_DN13523_c0_g1_i1.p1 TRINITY_DN13523_c0_g1~~TRINITY_DN13523_c0_g1_i1.p1  ORF type:complete len:497 (-),score=115.81 TRINITY_DN13523_c0_g1_i1:82-1572(-)
MAGSFLEEVDEGSYEPLDRKGAHVAAATSSNFWTVFSAAVANFNIQYNFQVITIVLAFMDNGPKDRGGSGGDEPLSQVAFERSKSQTDLLSSAVFAGAICGQCVMGFLGDLIGRRRALLLTNLLVVMGAMGSALFPFSSTSHSLLDDEYNSHVYLVITMSRFVLGIGVGGKYPLTAVSRHEDSGAKHSGTEVAKAFFWQVPGQIAPFVLALVMYEAWGRSTDFEVVSLQVRILLGLGALPAVLVFVLTWFKQKDSTEYQAAQATKPSLLASLKAPGVASGFIGTAVSWMVYDYTFYGTTVFQSTVLNDIFGKGETLEKLCWQNTVISAVGLPAVILATLQLEQFGAKQMQVWGFVSVGFASLILTFFKGIAPEQHMLIFAAYLFLIFTLNWGVNITTFVLPAQCFPAHIRSTFNGFASAGGKMGALIGSSSFDAIEDSAGFCWTYVICAIVSVVGMSVTILFIPGDKWFRLDHPLSWTPWRLDLSLIHISEPTRPY